MRCGRCGLLLVYGLTTPWLASTPQFRGVDGGVDGICYTFNMKNKGGRTTKFKAEFIEEMYKFFNCEPERKEVIKSMVEYGENGKEKRKAEEYKILPAKFPSLYAFSRHIGVHYDNMHNWAEFGKDKALEERIKNTANNGVISKKDAQMALDLKAFHEAYKHAKLAQKQFLINVGLSGAANAHFTIFTAKNVTDMRDKIETEVSHRIVSPLLENMALDNTTQSLPSPRNTDE